MKIIHSKKARKQRIRNLFSKFTSFFTRKKAEPFTRKVYINRQPMKKYEFKCETGFKTRTTVGRTLSEAKDNADKLLREEYPTKKVHITSIWEVKSEETVLYGKKEEK